MRAFAAIGLLGGFTTFSTMVVESDRLLGNGQAALSAVYLVLSLTLGMLACAGGYVPALLFARVPSVTRRRR